MASYESYKKISADSIADGAVDAADFTVPLNLLTVLSGSMVLLEQ